MPTPDEPWSLFLGVDNGRVHVVKAFPQWFVDAALRESPKLPIAPGIADAKPFNRPE